MLWMPFFVNETGDLPTGAQSVVAQGTSIMIGSNATEVLITSLPGLVRVNLLADYPDVFYDRLLYNGSRSGANSWDMLAKIPTNITPRTPTFCVMDFSNDNATDHYRKSREAWIRRMWTLFPECNIAVIFFPAITVGGTVEYPYSVHEDLNALLNHYGIPHFDANAALDALIDGGAAITEYYNYPTDRVHPLDTGHALAWSLLAAEIDNIVFNDRQLSGSLPTRYYDGSDEYENESPTFVSGTEYDSKTGTWTEDATGYIQSNEADATVTYSGTFATIGYERDSGSYPLIDYSVDGGAYVTSVALDHHGIYIGIPAARTVTFRVRSGTTVRIDKFLAV